jgi:peptidylprolyl isomerase
LYAILHVIVQISSVNIPSAAASYNVLYQTRQLAAQGNIQPGPKGDQMEEARPGSRVRIHYTAKLKTGEVVGTSKAGYPLTFTIGKGKVFKPLEEGVVGMQPGQSRTIEIPPEKGYGHRRDELVMMFEKSKFSKNIPLEVGRTVQFRGESQEVVNLIIVEVGEDTVTVDANHPFADQTIVYEVHLVGLN